MSAAQEINHAIENAKGWAASIEEMVEALANASQNGGTDRAIDDAQQTIQESVLSVEVRDGWKQPGADSEGAEEYRILLTTGGPALQLIGRLTEHGEPESARLQWQDWGTPWTDCHGIISEHNLLVFAQQFYFGE